jgi:hypothetical protein
MGAFKNPGSSDTFRRGDFRDARVPNLEPGHWQSLGENRVSWRWLSEQRASGRFTVPHREV